MSGEYTYAKLPVKLPAISLAININPVSPIGIAGGGLCIADGSKPTAYICGPDGTLTPVYGKVTVFESRRGKYKISDHLHLAAVAQQAEAIRLAQEGKISLGMLRTVFDR